MRKALGIVLVALVTTLQPNHPANAVAGTPGALEAAIADPSRPDKDREADAHRKPAEVLAFAGVKPGDKVAELIPGGGYFTRIFVASSARAGPLYGQPGTAAAETGCTAAPVPPSCPNLTALTSSSINFPSRKRSI